jgi:hypothetical protein
MRLNFSIYLLVFSALTLLIGLCNFIVYGQTNDSLVTTNSTSIMQSTPLEPIPFQPLNLGDTPDQTQASSNSGFIVPKNNGDETKNNDLILLNQKYNNEKFGDHIVGELLNNGTETANFVMVSVSFYDEDGIILGSVSGVTEPSSIPPGGKAAFDIIITSRTIDHDSEKYEFSIQWSGEDFNQHTVRITDPPSIEKVEDD